MGITICLGLTLLLMNLLRLSSMEALLFVVPVIGIDLIICLMAWPLCQATQLEWQNLPDILVRHGISLTISLVIWLPSTQAYCLLLRKLNLTQTNTWDTLFDRVWFIQLTMGLFMYILMTLIYYLIIAQEKVKDAERMALEQYYHSVQAELKSIRSTVHPHFLFNVLTTLEALIKADAVTASRVCLQLSDFLRHSLKHGNRDQVTIKDELEHIKNYLGIEKVRFGDRLELIYDVDSEILDEPVIPLILLPLVENAVKHGIQQLLEGGAITVRIKRESMFFHIQVLNPFEKPNKKPEGEGMGLQNLQQRIRSSYGDRSLLKAKKQGSLFSVDLFLQQLVVSPTSKQN